MTRCVSNLSSFVMTCSVIIPLFALLLIPGIGLFDSSSQSAFAQNYEIPNMEKQGETSTTTSDDTKEESPAMDKVSVGNIDVTMSPLIQGSENAPITIIEFGDFQCPKCDQWFQNEKPTIKSQYIDTGKANLYFVDFTFLGDDSLTAANASYCAEEQGKYWEFHSHLYDNQGGINEGWASSSNLKLFASYVGLDVVAFDECLDSGKYDDRVTYNTNVGASNGVEGTPAFFIVDNSNGATERIDGPQSSDIFAGVIDEMIGDLVVPASAAEEEEIMSDVKDKSTEIASDVTEQTEEIVSETENQVEDIETENQVEDIETENQVEDIENTADERSEINVNVGDNTDNGGGGCLIATAAYGTELAPQVQFLREIRDNTVMSTASGASFMTGFNQLYYLFSPAIADMERENPMFQQAVRAFITPMVSTLSIMTLADDGNEAEVLGLGISVIALNLGMYIAAPALVGFTVSKHLKSKKNSSNSV